MKTHKKVDWVKWPFYRSSTMKKVQEVFESNRWAITGYWTEQKSMEQKFAEKFAQFNGVNYCLPTTNCTSALQIAMEALDIGFGDEVIVPALTWVATATAVLNVNAKPVLVDVDPDTYCIDPQKIEEVITSKTKAIIPVHLYSSMADMDTILPLAKKYGLYVIEDCAQSHGAEWNHQKAGTLGDIGCFSMQHGKVITSGEGGAIITNNKWLYEKIDHLRADSRTTVSADELKYGDMQIVPKDVFIQGNNYCLSEFQSAILIDQIDLFEEQNELRNQQADYVGQLLKEIEGIQFQLTYPGNNKSTIYSYCIKLDRNIIRIHPKEICRELSSQLDLGSFFIHPSYPAVHKNPIFCPWTKNRFDSENAQNEEYWRNMSFKNAESASENTIVLHHSLFLNCRENLDFLVQCLKNILIAAR